MKNILKFIISTVFLIALTCVPLKANLPTSQITQAAYSDQVITAIIDILNTIRTAEISSLRTCIDEYSF